MLRLVGAELHRFRLRALFWVAGIAVVGFVAVILVQAYGQARPPSAAAVAEAQRYMDRDLQQWEAYQGSDQAEADEQQCLADQAEARKSDPTVDYACDQTWAKPALEQYLPYRGTYAESATDLVVQYALVLLLMSLAVGASFITAEASTGALATWLSFEPRRTRVFGAKAVALSTGVVAISAACLLVLNVGLRLVYAAFDRLGDPEKAHAALVSAAQTSGRMAVAAVAFALIGYALGAVARHAAIAVGVLLVYLAAVEGVLRGVFPALQRWLLSTDVLAWIQGEHSYSIATCVRDETSGYYGCDTWVDHTVTQAAGGWYLLAVVGVLTLGAWAVFRRRDVA